MAAGDGWAGAQSQRMAAIVLDLDRLDLH